MIKNKLPVVLYAITRIYLVFFQKPFISDLEYYRYFGEKLTLGLMPYKDFSFEYPPLSLFWIGLPALLSNTDSAYRLIYHLLCLACDIVLFKIISKHLRSQIKSSNDLILYEIGYIFMGVILAPLYFDRIDLPMTLFVVLAWSSRREWVSGFWITLGSLTKLIPGLIFPVFYPVNNKKYQRNYLLLTLGIPVAVTAMIGWATKSVTYLSYHFGRGFQIESFWSVLTYFIHRLFGIGEYQVHYDHGGWNAITSYDTWLLPFSTILFGVGILYGWVIALRNRTTLRDKSLYIIQVFLIFVLLGKVFSPQYMIWFIPLVFLTNRIRLDFLIALSIALGCTRVVFLNYQDLLNAQLWAFAALFFRFIALIYLFIHTTRLLSANSRSSSYT